MKYSTGFKANILGKMSDGTGKSAYQVSKETGISVTTIQDWLKKSKDGILVFNGSAEDLSPSKRSPSEKLILILEVKTIPEQERGEWLRKNGLHSEHIALWEQELMSTLNDRQSKISEENAALKKENRELKKDLAKKEKALAETAVLLALKKKYHHLFGEDEED
jgi:transposase